ncbi:MAG TPA: Mur ligase family protein [Acidimicrobiales bacterium]|nr:Mur ligase family protein [Acidimicrobiales bacterium]
MSAADAAALALAVAGIVLATVRWLRVAQREHYVLGEPTRFAWRWWASSLPNAALGTAAVAAAVAAAWWAPAAFVAAAVAMAGPIGLGLRGRTGRLAWTRRLTTLAVASVVVEAVAIGIGALAGGLAGAAAAAAATAIASPLGVDLALVLTHPVEEAVARRYVARARARLERVRPLVVAVTGSYGKTTVKGYIAHLAAPFFTVLPSPRSFNNRAGLARTVNEHLGPGTEVLVAEMGTYGPGEIAAMCKWVRPEISVMTAIGPAHLQRFRSLDRTLAAKAEITETARTVVLNVDDERLRGLAPVLRAAGKKVIEASGSNEVADVAVIGADEGLELRIEGRRVGAAFVPAPEMPTSLSNAACAAAVALELGVAPDQILARLANLPLPPNRLQRYMADGGYVVYDDTFNSNPTGARIGLARLKSDPEVAPAGRRVVVTPGMVELGPLQHRENAQLGETAARVADHLVIVARTNRRALLEGVARAPGGAVVTTVDRFDQALDWVRTNLGPGDAVLYENDLPDHFP